MNETEIVGPIYQMTAHNLQDVVVPIGRNAIWNGTRVLYGCEHHGR